MVLAVAHAVLFRVHTVPCTCTYSHSILSSGIRWRTHTSASQPKLGRCVVQDLFFCSGSVLLLCSFPCQIHHKSTNSLQKMMKTIVFRKKQKDFFPKLVSWISLFTNGLHIFHVPATLQAHAWRVVRESPATYQLAPRPLLL